MEQEQLLYRYWTTLIKRAKLKKNLCKVYDVLDHKILAHKLEHYGFGRTLIDLLTNFVRNRNYFENVMS